MMRACLPLLLVLSAACEAPPIEPPVEQPIDAQPEPAEPEAPGPAPAEPEAPGPEPAEPEPAEPEPAEPEPAEPEPVEPLNCDALDLSAPEHRQADGRYRLTTDVWDVPINGLCPVSDFSITHGADAVFTFTARHAGVHRFATVGDRLNGLSLHAGCDRREPLLCASPPHYHDSDLGERPLSVRWEMQAGATVYVFVDGYHAARLGVEVIGPAGEGEACGQTLCDETGRCSGVQCAPGTQCWDRTCQTPPPPGPLGARCDGFARCEADLICLADACAAPPEPALEHGWATWHAGRLFASATVFDPSQRAEGPELRAGEVQLPGGADRERHYWSEINIAVDPMPATVQIFDGDRVLAEIDVIPQPEIAVGAACHRLSGLDRCALGSLCLPVGEDTRCVAAEVVVWREPAGGERVFADIRAPGLTRLEPIQSDGFFEPIAVEPERWIGQKVRPEAGAISLWHGADLFIEDLPLSFAPPRREGEPCDPLRVASICRHGSACMGETCEIVHPPRVTAAMVVKTPEAVGIWVRGRDPNQDVVGLEIANYSNAFDPDAPTAWFTSALTWDGDEFEGWLSDDAGWRAGGWRDAELVLIDREGRRSFPFPVGTGDVGIRAPADAGAECDRIGALFPCADGLLCDTREGADEPLACRALEVACDPDVDTPIALDRPLSIDAPGATNQTRTTCDRWDDPGAEHRLRFVPEANGFFVAEVVSNEVYSLAARRGCHLPLSEIACTDEFERAAPLDGDGAHGIAATLPFDAVAGEQITIIVDGTERFDIQVRRR